MVSSRFPQIVPDTGYTEVQWARVPHSEFLDEIGSAYRSADDRSVRTPSPWSIVVLGALFGIGLAFW